MTLIVEDGSVVADADSFLSLNDARADALKRGLTLATDDTEAETELVNAYNMLISNYEMMLKGYRVSGSQTGCFPRNGVYAYGYSVSGSAIPREIKQAQVNIASALNSGVNTNNVKTDADLASFNVQGVYSETYNANSAKPTTPRFTDVENILKPYFKDMNKLNRDDYFDRPTVTYGRY